MTCFGRRWLQHSRPTADQRGMHLECRARARRDEDGFSILETVLALALFAVMVVGIAASAGSGLRLTSTSNARQEATQIGVRAIEVMRGANYDTLGMPTGT